MTDSGKIKNLCKEIVNNPETYSPTFNVNNRQYEDQCTSST
jgi:hypothetical protein